MSSAPTAAIISIGDELVLGELLDTNARDIAETLVERGVRVVTHLTVPDDETLIREAMHVWSSRCDLVLSTGGLGPTKDDLTRAALATLLAEPLVEDHAMLQRLNAWAAERRMELTEGQRAQALRPASARALPNERGTAPGLLARHQLATIACLPGPPGEMRPMLERVLADTLPASTEHTVGVRLLHAFGIGEGRAAELLGDLMRRDRNPLVGTTASRGIVTCRVRFAGPTNTAERELAATRDEVRERLGHWVFGEDGETLADAAVSLLKQRNERLAVVESCTGGMLGAELTSVSGASGVFEGGWIAYSNEMKHDQVGVPDEVIERDGAVSHACASAMASGALHEWPRADHAIAITGIAGPDGGTMEKPVGTVFIALASRAQGSRVRRFEFPGGRSNVRRWSMLAALAMLRFALIDADPGPMIFERADA